MSGSRRRSSVRFVVCALALAVALPVAAAPKHKPTVGDSLSGQAREDYDAARVLFDHDDFTGAAIKYQSAYDHSKDVRLLWNIASCEQRLRHYARTRTVLERYLAEGDKTLTEQDRKDADAILTAIAPYVSTVKVTVEPEGADVTLDNEVVGRAPLASPIYVELGKHEVGAKKDGFRPDSRAIAASGGDTIPVSLKLEPKPHEGQLEVRAGRDERIALDGEAIGVGTVTRTVPSGRHTLRVGSGSDAREMPVIIEDDRARIIDLRNASSGSSATPWIIAGGAVVAAGLAVGAYFLFRPSPKSGTETPGTLGGVELP